MYNFMKTHYQNFEEKKVKEILVGFAGKKVLDYGCGQGKYLQIMRKMRIDCAGIDINARQAADLQSQGFAVHTDISGLEKNSFDCLLLSHVIEHLSGQELVNLFDSLLPLLKGNGKIILITPVLGERFYYDFTHIRPYYPQSIRMLFGGISTPMSVKSKYSAELEDIFFFRDSFKLRLFRAFYPAGSASGMAKKILSAVNMFFSFLHYYSGGRIGRTASWLGIYTIKGMADDEKN